jgi:hypothetical protein
MGRAVGRTSPPAWSGSARTPGVHEQLRTGECCTCTKGAGQDQESALQRVVVKGGLLVSQPPTSVRIPEKELAMVGTMPIRTNAGRKQRPRGTTERVSTARACSSALQRRA